MAFNFFGQDPNYFDFSQWGAPAAPAPAGLTLEDLWRPREDTVYPEPPTPIASYAALATADPEARKALRREAILRAAAAFGGPSGQWGQGLVRAAQGVDEWKKGQVDEANQRQGQEYAASYRRTEQDAKRKEQDADEAAAKRRAMGSLAAVQAITEKEPSWAARAEAAAREGRHQDLDAMLKALPEREALRSQGIDPDDPYADDRAKEGIKDASEREQEDYWRKHGLKGYYHESPEEAAARAGAVADAQGRAWQKYRKTGDGSTGPDGYPIRMVDGRPYEVVPDGNGGSSLRPIPGAPPDSGRWQMVPGDPREELPPYRVNVETGEISTLDSPYTYNKQTKKWEVKPDHDPGLRQRQKKAQEAADASAERVHKQMREEGFVQNPVTGQWEKPKTPTLNGPSKAPTNGPNPNRKSPPPKEAMPPGKKSKASDAERAAFIQQVNRQYPNASPADKDRILKAALERAGRY